MAKTKFYVVWEGHTPGIYTSWDAAKRQVDGFPQAKYKSFSSRAEAEKAYASSYWAAVGQSTPSAKKGFKSSPPQGTLSLEALEKAGVHLHAVAVDAACSGNPGKMEYRGVYIATGEELFRVGPLDDGTNNIGEFLAIVHALAMLKKQNQGKTPIYSDSKNAQLWVKLKTCRTKLDPTGRNEEVFDLIHRAEQWLASHTYTNPIYKWETDQWGEIPADFGRK